MLAKFVYFVQFAGVFCLFGESFAGIGLASKFKLGLMGGALFEAPAFLRVRFFPRRARPA